MTHRILCALLACFAALTVCAAMPTDPPVPYLQVAASTPPPEVVVDAANLQPSPEEMALRVEEGTSLFLKGAVFDPIREAEPFAGNRIATASPYRLVQFEAPLTLEQQKELEAAGAEVLEYIPTNGYIVRINSSEGQQALSGHPGLRWIGAHRGGQKIAPMLSSKAWRQGLFVDVRLFRGENPFSNFDEIQKIDPSVAIAAIYDRGLAGKLLRIFVPEGRLHPFIEQASEIPGILALEPWFLPAVRNDNSIWVIQSFDTTNKLTYTTSATMWTHGITGTGQTPAVCDSGLDSDMCFFRLSSAGGAITDAQFPALPLTGTIDNTKKVIVYIVLPGSNEYDNNAICPGGTSPISWHGTHVSGTVLGDNYATLSTPTTGGHNAGDGMAPNAKLVFQDAGDNAGCLSGLSNDNYLIFQQAYDAGARVHNNSWGSDAAGAYTADSEVVDEFMYDYEDFTLFFSNGNNGPGGTTVGSPATAKNCVSVGATTNGSAGATAMASFSSRGPCTDGRRKPEICAPGNLIVSASGTTNHTDNNCATKSMSGTSMSSPTATGGATLLRQYFTDGFYPTGAKAAADALNPSSALMKAALINGAVQYTLTTQATMMNSLTLDMAQGYGRQVLDTVAYFTGDARRTRAWDRWNSTGLTTGQQDTFTVAVAAGQAFKVALAWTDPQASAGASVALINNLDLEVVEPNGTTIYKGNVFAGGQSATAGTADALNNAEVVFRSAPTAGTWTIRVKATSIPGAPSKPDSVRQGYALVATYASCTNSPVLVAPTGLTATDNGTTGINLAWGAVTGATNYQIYRATGNCSVSGSQFHYLGQTTGATYTDTLAQGGFTYAYVVRAATTCSEGPASACATAIFTGNCNLKPTFSGVSGVVNDTATVGCDLVVSWPAGTSRCPLAPGVSYNLYRSTTPYFTPGVANRIVTGVTGTSYRDTGVLANTTYYYCARVEDGTTTNGGPANGGNEDGNTALAMGTPTASTATNGTWSDAGGDNTLARLTLESPWRVTNRQNHTAAGTFSYHAGPDTGNYPPMTCAAATTPAITLQAGAPSLSYWVRYDLEYQWDGVVTEISTNGGGAWTIITPSAGYPDVLSTGGGSATPINACGFALTQRAFTGPVTNGTLSAWTQYTHNLTAYAGQTVMLRWRLSSDPGLEFEGFYLDDIQITLASVPDACSTTCTAPGAPTLTSATGTCAGVNLAWTAGTGTTNSYNVYRFTGACGGAYAMIAGPIVGLAYSDTTAVAGTSYAYVVRGACDAGGTTESGNSNCLIGTRLAVPAAPTGVSATPSCTGNSIAWTNAPTATSHNVVRGTVCGTAVTTFTNVTSPYNDTTAIAGTTYNYWVVGVNTCGTSAISACATAASVAAPVAPAAPTFTSVLCTSLTVNWVASGGTSYDVWRATGNGTCTGAVKITSTPVAGTSYPDSGLAPNTQYSYYIVANNACGTSPNGACAAVVTTCLPNIVYMSRGAFTAVDTNGDATMEAGEKYSVQVTLQNTGLASAANVQASLSGMALGDGITVCDNPGTFGTIAPGGTASYTFNFVVDPATWYTSYACGTNLTFNVVSKSTTTPGCTCADELTVFSNAVGIAGTSETATQVTTPLNATSATVNSTLAAAFAIATPAATASLSYTGAYTPAGSTPVTLFGPDTIVNLNNWTASGYALRATGGTCHGVEYARSNNVTGTFTLTQAASISTVGYSTVTVTMDWGMSAAGPTQYLEWSTDNITYTPAASTTNNGWLCNQSVVLPAGAAGQATLWIRFRTVTTGGRGQVDYVSIVGTPAGGTGDWMTNAQVSLVDPLSTATILKAYGAADASPYNVLPYYTGPGTYQIRLQENNGGTATVTVGSMTVTKAGTCAAWTATCATCTPPGAPVITGITDVDACLQNGIQISYTAGSGALSHDLYKDAVLAVTGYVSGATYTPGDTASHNYTVRAIDGTCTTDSNTMAGTDAVCAPPPEVAPGTGGVLTALTCTSSGVSWPAIAEATTYNLYRGVLADLLNGNILNSTEDSCYRYQGAANQATGLADDPAAVAGRFYWYLVTGANGGGEGSAGTTSAAVPRVPNASTTCP